MQKHPSTHKNITVSEKLFIFYTFILAFMNNLLIYTTIYE